MEKKKKSPYADDPRIEKILGILVQYAAGDYSERGEISEKEDEIDAITLGLNALADEAANAKKITQHYLNRIEKVMEVLLKYTVLDFSETLPISSQHDEIDAISIGLNTLAEELQTARKVEKEQLEIISENKEQIEVILNNAPNGVMVLRADGSIIRWNSRSEKIFKWSQEEMIGEHYEKILAGENPAELRSELENFFMKSDSAEQQFELQGSRKPGDVFTLELAISVVKNKGEVLFVCFMDDISARKDAEHKLMSAYQNLEESNKELEAFTYSVSHDLRAPLRAISGYSQILSEKSLKLFDPESQKFFNAIISNTKKMGNLIDDLLALSRFSRAELKRTEVNMNELVSSVIDQLSKSQDHKKVNFKITKLPSVMADQNLMTQVYTNLISNAVKYSSLESEPVVEIGSKNENGKVVFYVKDNGTGFDMEFYNKLFGVFQRLHDSKQFEGTGVGLAIVKRVITKHNGTVWAESELGKGSVFYFTLN